MPMFLTMQKAKRDDRFGKGVEVHRSHQTVACRNRCVGEPRKPRRVPVVVKTWTRYAAIEAMRGKPRNRTRLKPNARTRSHGQVGGIMLRSM